MAIKLKKTSVYGDTIQPEYWMVGIANIHPINRQCYVVLFGFLDATARTGGKESLAKMEISIPWNAFSNSNNPNIKDIYTHLKTLDDWKTGEDV